MPLPPPRSHRISLSDASTLVRSRSTVVKGGFFFRKELDELLAQPSCSGIRYYYAKDSSGNDTIILVGVDQEGNDLVQGVLMEDSFFCPPFCGNANALNS
jgi:hypothetical protein